MKITIHTSFHTMKLNAEALGLMPTATFAADERGLCFDKVYRC